MSLKRVGALDSLRGLAALLVFVLHAALYLVAAEERFAHTDPLPEFASFFAIGRVGVVIFFALSGYLIAGSLRAPGWRSSFPLKRFLRLYPLFLASALAALLLLGEPFTLGETLANLSLLPTLLGQRQILEVYWTLQTEVIFYALFFGLKLAGLLEGRRPLWLVSAGFTAGFILCQLLVPEALFQSLPLMLKKLPQHLGIMFLGGYLSTIDGDWLRSRAAAALLLLTAAPSLYTLGEHALSGFAGHPPVMTSYLTALMLFLAVLRFQPTHPLAEGLGRISYSIYLLHPLVIQLATPYLPKAGLLASVLMLLAPTLVLSALSYRLIERPAIVLSRRLSRPPAAATTPAALPPSEALS